LKELILNEEKLIASCIDNIRHAQESLYNQFYKEMYLLAMRYLSDHNDAEDAVVLSFTKIYKSLKKFNYNGKGSLGKWMRTILIHESIRIIKQRKLLHFSDDLQFINIVSDSANGLQQMQASDIMLMIERLPTGYRTIFNLYVVEGYNHREIGEMLNISENTSKTQLKKARTSLMNKINTENAYGTI
jgi:RNA polymerase sigma-70 factor (ECF subfamily)